MGFEGLFSTIVEILQSVLMETILSFITEFLGQVFPGT